MPRGNPDITEYKKDFWSTRVEPKLEMVTGWARNGLSDTQIALNLGITEPTFIKYKKEHEELNEALYLGREDAEICVENAMFKSACGYYFTEQTRERQKVFDKDGRWTGQFEMVTTKKVRKFVQPSVDAQKYWLEHRAPRRWERTPTVDPDMNLLNAGIRSLAELLKNPVEERQIGCENES